MIRQFVLLTSFATVALAQPSQASAVIGSISGVVTNTETRAPIPQAIVTAITSRPASNSPAAEGKRITAATDAQGRYSLTELPFGQYVVFARFKGRLTSKTVTLNSSQEQASVDFVIAVSCVVSGKVLDEDGAVVPHATVNLIEKEYQSGVLRWFITDATTTDDRGEYRLEHAERGRVYVVKARPRDKLARPVSDAPADPKLRHAVLVPAYYPNTSHIEGAVPLMVGKGGVIDGVDIRMSRLPYYCIDGTLEAGGIPSGLHFFIEEVLQTGGGGFIPMGGSAGSDGKIRICDLRPGLYRLTALRFAVAGSGSEALFGVTTVGVTDDDVHNVKVLVNSGMPVSGQVMWDGTPPNKPIDATVSIELQPLNRAMLMGEVLVVKSSIPGSFTFPGLLPDDYEAKTVLTSPGLYVKDITYAGVSVLHEPLRHGKAIGNASIDVVVGFDGGSVDIDVADKDRNPIPHANLAIMPAGASSESALASQMVLGQADQSGHYSSGSFSPGKYYVFATEDSISLAYESVSKLWGIYSSKATVVDIAAGRNMQATVEPIKLE